MGETIAPGTFRSGGNPLEGLVSNVLGVQKIKAVKEEAATNEAVKTSLIRKRLEDERKTRDTESKAIFSKEVEGAFGATPSPEIEPYITPSRELFESKGSVTAPLFTSRDISEGANLINRPVTISDIRPQLKKSAEEYRQEQVGIARRLPASAEPVATETEIKSRKLPASAVSVSAQLSKLRTEGAKASQEELTAQKQAGTLKADISTAESTATIKAVQARGAEEVAALDLREKRAKAISAEVDSKYAEVFKQKDIEIQDLDKRIKEAQLRKEPLDYKAAQLDLELKQTQISKARLDAKRESRIAALRSQYEGETDSARRAAILTQLAVENGHEATLLTADTNRATAYVNATEAAQKMFLTAQAASDVATKQSAFDSYNTIQIQAATLAGSKTVRLQTTHLVERRVLSDTLETGSATVPTDIAIAWKDGTLDKAITGAIRGVDPGWALAAKIRIEYAYGQGDKKVFENAVASAIADPVVKQRALELLGDAEKSLGIKQTEEPKKPETTEKKPTVGRSTAPTPRGVALVDKPTKEQRAAQIKAAEKTEIKASSRDDFAREMFGTSYMRLLPSQRKQVDAKITK